MFKYYTYKNLLLLIVNSIDCNTTGLKQELKVFSITALSAGISHLLGDLNLIRTLFKGKSINISFAPPTVMNHHHRTFGDIRYIEDERLETKVNIIRNSREMSTLG